MPAATTIPPRSSGSPVRLGVVSFLNTLPLIDGLENLRDLELKHSVPSLLIDQLLSGEVDAALCSSIDYQLTDDPLVILPVGVLGSDGPTLTVRLYSKSPIEGVCRVHCDTDSHTSIALMRILLAELHDVRPELIAYDAREHVAQNRPIEHPDTVLLIGDKVVTDSPPAVRYPYQLDLGAAWKQLTGLPFVFAAWMARRETDPARLRTAAAALDHQRRHNRQRLDFIIHTQARVHQWPIDLASDYLKNRISYAFTDEHLAALDLFYEKAHRLGLVKRHLPVELLKV